MYLNHILHFFVLTFIFVAPECFASSSQKFVFVLDANVLNLTQVNYQNKIAAGASEKSKEAIEGVCTIKDESLQIEYSWLKRYHRDYAIIYKTENKYVGQQIDGYGTVRIAFLNKQNNTLIFTSINSKNVAVETTTYLIHKMD
jgi:hypothetical protein